MGQEFLRRALAVKLFAPTTGVDGLPREFLNDAVSAFIRAINDRSGRFAAFNHYVFAIDCMRAAHSGTHSAIVLTQQLHTCLQSS